MGCKICRGCEQEPQMNINCEDVVKEITEEILAPKEIQDNQDYDNFMSLFNAKLPSFRKILPKDGFESIIPKNFKNESFENKAQYPKNSKIYKFDPIQFNNGDIYEGSWNQECNFHGEGKFYIKEKNIFIHGIWIDSDLIYANIYFPQGDIYEGEIKEQNFNGKGKLTSSEEIYEGDFVDGQKEGKGKLIFNDNVIYEGNFNKDEFYGNGKMIWTNGYTYEGEFKGQILMGDGILTNSQGDKFEGQFHNNLFNGRGKYTYSNGNIYEGEFKYGYKSGKGAYTIKNKYIFEGDWENDLPNGNGKLFSLNKNLLLKASWREGMIIEETIDDNGNENKFTINDLNIFPDEMSLNTKLLSHLDKIESIATQYNIGEETLPSFMND